MSETVEWAIALSETVEWAIAMLVAPLELYCAIVSGYYLSFKLSGKVVFLLGPELPTGDGWERASHWSCIAPDWRLFFFIFVFKLNTENGEKTTNSDWNQQNCKIHCKVVSI